MAQYTPFVTQRSARGCLLGLAVGEALGLPVTGLSRARLQRYCGAVSDYLDASCSPLAPLGRSGPSGAYGSGTQQALLVAEVLAARGDYDAVEAQARFLALAQPRPGLPRGVWRGASATLRAALDRMACGLAATETGVPSAGSGAAVRCVPLGLRFAGDAAALQPAAILCALQTHADARAISAASIVAYLAGRLALQPAGQPLLPSYLLSEVAEYARESEVRLASEYGLPREGQEPPSPGISDMLLLLAALGSVPRHEALRAILLQAGRLQPAYPLAGPSEGFSPAAVPTSIWLALTSESFEEAVSEAVNLGGAADTVGALTGALAGARWGEEAIPARWLEGLQNRDTVVARADALVGGVKAGGFWEELAAAERRLSWAQVRVREGW